MKKILLLTTGGTIFWRVKMKNKCFIGVLFVFFLFIACGNTLTDQNNDQNNDKEFTTGTVTALTLNKWSDGTITSSNNEQWFKFTATENRHYIHVFFGTLTNLYIQLYDSKGNVFGDRVNLKSSSNNYFYRNVAIGIDYFIKVTPYSNSSGTYKTGITNSILSPDSIAAMDSAYTLTSNIWTDGVITTLNSQQWYRFTATNSTHYIHINFGTLTRLYIQLYDSTGSTLGDQKDLSSNSRNKYTSFLVSSGQVYYLRVTPYSSTGSGTYQIGITNSVFTPDTIAAMDSALTLNYNTWTDVVITSSKNEQWYKFTAINSTIYILNDTLLFLGAQLYDSTGSELGNEILYEYNYISFLVTNGQVYYIKFARASGNGTYRIALTTYLPEKGKVPF